MVMSWGTGLPEELLLLVRENREDWALHGLSLSSSSSRQPTTSFLLSLSLFALHLPSHSSSSSIPTSLHTFISLSASLSKESVNQTESQRRDVYPAGGWTGYCPCSGDGLGTESPRLLEHTQKTLSTHSKTLHLHLLSLLFTYPSFRFTGRLDFIISTIICLVTVFDKERQRRLERGSGYIIFLNRVHIAKLCHQLTRYHFHGNTMSDASSVFCTSTFCFSLLLLFI